MFYFFCFLLQFCVVCVFGQENFWQIPPSRNLAGLPETILRLGGIFEGEDPDEETAFKFAVDYVNTEINILPRIRLTTQIAHLRPGNAFEASSKFCSLMNEGIGAIFGPQSPEGASHVQSIADAFEIPHIETKWDFHLRKNNYLINLTPHPDTIGMAFKDLVEAWNWDKYVIIYENNESLFLLQTLLKSKNSGILRQLPQGDDYRPFLKAVLRDSDIKNIVLDCNINKLWNFLKQAQQVGLITREYSYIVTSLDMQVIDLEDFKYSEMNLTSFRIIDPERPEVQQFLNKWTSFTLSRELPQNNLPNNHRQANVDNLGQVYGYIYEQNGRNLPNHRNRMITTETGLIMDSVHLYAKALNVLESSQRIEIKPLSCESSEMWQFGYSIINYMKMVQQIGLTGLIQFNTSGFRTDISLDVIQLTPSGIIKIGAWDNKFATKFNWTKFDVVGGEIDPDLVDLANKTLVVTTIINSPFTMLTRSEAPLAGNERYEGYAIEVLDRLSKKLGFKYIVKIVDDNAYGSFNNKTKKWNGMIKMILEGTADIAIGDITINKDRQQAVSFTMPFMNLGITILFTTPKSKPPSLFSFMSPFSTDVWIWMAFAFFGVSFVLLLFGRITPMEWDNPYACIEEPDTLINQFTVNNTLWCTIGSIMQQGSDIAPKAVSTRIITSIWYFFTLIMVSSYTANLATFLIVEDLDIRIKSLEDLPRQTKVQYGCVATGSTAAFFRDSPFESKRKIWDKMMAMKPSPFAASNKEGVDRVSKSEGTYAFFMESTVIEYNIERSCGLAQVGGLLDSKGYGIALPKGSRFRQAFNSGILSLQETGVLDELKRKWWKEERRDAGTCASRKDEDVKPLMLANVGGVFVVLLVGCLASTLLAFIELFRVAREQTKGGTRGSIIQHVRDELKFAMDLHEDSKPVAKRKSIDNESGSEKSKEFIVDADSFVLKKPNNTDRQSIDKI